MEIIWIRIRINFFQCGSRIRIRIKINWILSTGGLQVGHQDIEEEINKSVFSAEDGDQGVFPKFSTQILMTLKLKTLEWDILNLDYLIWVSNRLLIFFVNYSFLDSVEKNQKPAFKLRSPSCFLKFQISRLLISDSDWLNFIHNHDIMKKRGSSINPDIHHSKVFSSGLIKGRLFDT